MFLGLPTLVGILKNCAEYFNQVAEETGADPCMLAFPNFVKNLVDFGAEILSLMQGKKKEMETP
jgi:hypothetical protein